MSRSEDHTRLPPTRVEGQSQTVTATPSCRICGKSEWVCVYREDAPHTAICVECCPTATHADEETGHVWEYERAERDHSCIHCGQFRRNTDWEREPVEGDIPLSFIGQGTSTPISQLSGRPGEPGFAEFCRIAKSWGYD